MGYRDIRDYAAIGDCHGAALVARDGRVDWCALARIDGAPVLCGLLDDATGGCLETKPAGAFGVERGYVEGTNILETHFEGDSGSAKMTDLMPVGRAPDANDDTTLRAPCWLVRIVEAGESGIELDVSMRPCVDWARTAAHLQPTHRGVAWQGGVLLCDRDLDIVADEGRAFARVRLDPGERMRIVLAPGGVGDADAALSAVDRLLPITRAFWHGWSARCRYDGPYADAVLRSALALKLLAYAPSGALAAALTTSLPECVGGTRNWDYRLCWVRDSTLTLFALASLGYDDEARRFSEFLFHVAAGGGVLPGQVVFGIEGETDLDESELDHLDGYKSSRPVRVGNAAYKQMQFDVFGEMLDWALLRAELGPDLAPEQKTRLRATADFVARHWQDPGKGIWEMRGKPQQHVYSKIMSWVALDRAARLGAGTHAAEKDRIRDAIREHGYASSGHLRQTFDGDRMDAALLRAPVVDFPLREGELDRTIDAVIRHLASDDIVYRYDGSDGVDGDEGTFLACGFWLVDALLFAGRVDEARARFEKLVDRANDVGLFSEEIDAKSGAFLGNFPQAFTHLALIHSATLLAMVERHGKDALTGTHADRVRRAQSAVEASRTHWSKLMQRVRALAHATDASVLDLDALGIARARERERA